MAKIWKEPLDVGRHRDHFTVGSWQRRTREHDGPSFSYFVQVAGFTFELASIEQLRACLAFFRMPIHPSSRMPVFAPESGHWQAWHERLPAKILKGSKRARVIAALERALVVFGEARFAWPSSDGVRASADHAQSSSERRGPATPARDE